MKRINIKESLLQFDKDTSCQYDLTSLYEACKIDEEDKKKLVQYIDAKDIEATNRLLSNKAAEQGLMEEVNDDISDDELQDIMGDSANDYLKENWTDVYKQFNDLVDKLYVGGNEQEVNDAVEALYREHEGEADWDNAWLRWLEPNGDPSEDPDYDKQLAYWKSEMTRINGNPSYRKINESSESGEVIKSLIDGSELQIIENDVIPNTTSFKATYINGDSEGDTRLFIKADDKGTDYLETLGFTVDTSYGDRFIDLPTECLKGEDFEGSFYMTKNDFSEYSDLKESIEDDSWDKSEVINWLEEHTTAWEDVTDFFGSNDLEEIELDDILGWISEHDMLYDDFLTFFGEDVKSLFDESLNEDSSNNPYECRKSINPFMCIKTVHNEWLIVTEVNGKNITGFTETDILANEMVPVELTKDEIKTVIDADLLGEERYQKEVVSLINKVKEHLNIEEALPAAAVAIGAAAATGFGTALGDKIGSKLLDEDLDASTIEQKIKDRANDILSKKYDDDFIEDYCEISVEDTEDNIIVHVNAELSYSDLEDLGTELTKVITEFDPSAYFEPECPGRLAAYVRKDQSEDIVDETILNHWTKKFNAVKSRDELGDVYEEFIKVRDFINWGTKKAIYDVVDAKLDEFPEEQDDIDFDSEVTFDESLNENFADITALADDCGENTFKVSTRDIRFTFENEDDKTKFVNELLSSNIPHNELTFGVVSINKSDALDESLIEDTDDNFSEDGTWFYDGKEIPRELRSKIKKVIIEPDVTTIGDYAFSRCSSLTSITIPDSVTEIGYGAFDECTRLESVKIGNGVKTIGKYAFHRCYALKSVIIPDNVTEIGEYAFECCESLENVVIGKNITEIKLRTFGYCSKLTNIIIPNNVVEIAGMAFENCYRLSSATIPDSVTYIGKDAFKVDILHKLNDGYVKVTIKCNKNSYAYQYAQENNIPVKTLNESLNEDNEPEKYTLVQDEREFNKFTVGGKDVPYTSHEEAKAHMKEDYPMESFIDELVEYMKGNDLYYSPYVNEEDNLVITVEDGDWKHEHLYLDRLIGKFFFNKGLIVDTETEVTEEDGSDCYSANHIYELKDLIFSMSIKESLINEDLNKGMSISEFTHKYDEFKGPGEWFKILASELDYADDYRIIDFYESDKFCDFTINRNGDVNTYRVHRGGTVTIKESIKITPDSKMKEIDIEDKSETGDVGHPIKVGLKDPTNKPINENFNSLITLANSCGSNESEINDNCITFTFVNRDDFIAFKEELEDRDITFKTIDGGSVCVCNESLNEDTNSVKTFSQWFDEVENSDDSEFYPFTNYVKQFPNAEVLKDVTAEDIKNNAHIFYDKYPVDSIDREKAFNFASEELNIDYDVLYDAWLHEEPINESLNEDTTTRTVGIYGDEVRGMESVEDIVNYLKGRGLTVSDVEGDMEYGWEMNVTGTPSKLYTAIVHTFNGYNSETVEDFISEYAIDDLDEGFIKDIANVAKSVASDVKNSKAFQKHVQPKVDKIKDTDTFKAIKDTDTFKNAKQGLDKAKEFVKNNIQDDDRTADNLSFQVRGKNYRASELKYRLNGKQISADEVAKMNAFQRRNVKIMVPRGVKPIKEGVASAPQMNWDDDDDFTYDAEVWEDATGVVSNKDFFAEGSDYTWMERVSSVETLDFDNWAVWSALNQETGETEYFVVEEDTEFIDWGPVDTEKEAKEFLQSKVDEWNLDESVNDSSTEYKVTTRHMKADIDTFNTFELDDKFYDFESAKDFTRKFEVASHMIRGIIEYKNGEPTGNRWEEHKGSFEPVTTEGLYESNNEINNWYSKEFPDDETGIEQLSGISFEDVENDKSIIDHCDTQVRDRVLSKINSVSLNEDGSKVLTYEELIELALENYNIGGDGVYECWDEKDFNDYVEEFGPITHSKALKIFRLYKERYSY